MPRSFLVNRGDLRDTRIAEADPPGALRPGQVRLKIERFALTANNITYGAFGDAMSYWSFFPVDDPWGQIPVWGFATVAESACDGIENGERLYGYYPMSNYLDIEAVNVSAMALVDGAKHREGLPPVYNRYGRTASDPMYDSSREAQHCLLMPLFATSFLLADFFEDNDFFGASSLILTSASSKTALGTAHVFAQAGSPGLSLIALTSPSNKAFVEQLDLYDQVFGYDEVAGIGLGPAALLEFSGNPAVVRDVHSHFGDDLKYSCAIGATHWDSRSGDGSQQMQELPGPQQQLFFAPAQAQKRLKEWGPEGYAKRFGGLWSKFVRSSDQWLTVQEDAGLESAVSVYEQLVDGTASPKIGYVITLEEST